MNCGHNYFLNLKKKQYYSIPQEHICADMHTDLKYLHRPNGGSVFFTLQAPRKALYSTTILPFEMNEYIFL